MRQRVGVTVSPEARRIRACRRRLSDAYLRGEGIEIGALHRPLDTPRAATVRYVDRHDVAGLRAQYPELAGFALVSVDIVDDGEALNTLCDNSMDFVIANHFIEHTQNPLATLGNHLRVLRPGGVLYLAVPDKRHTFDVDRPLTPLDHIVRDFAEGPECSRDDHFREWARLVDHAPDVDEHAARLLAMDLSIHFHVWTPETFRELLEHASDVRGLPFEIEELQSNHHEFIAVLRCTG